MSDQRIANKNVFQNLLPEDIEFFERISSRVTSSSAIPFDLPASSVFQIILDSLKWFWAWYPEATQEKLLVLRHCDINLFRKQSSLSNIDVKLPNGIEAIYDWTAVENGFGLGANLTNFMNYSLLNNFSSGVGSNFSSGKGGYGQSNMSMSNVVASLYEVNQYRETFTRGYRCNYNKNTQIFRIMTDIQTSLVLNCFVRLSPEELYGDIYFERYVTACVNEQLGKIITMFGFKLPGDVQLNYDQIKEDGKDTRKEIEEEIKGMNNTDFIQFKTN